MPTPFHVDEPDLTPSVGPFDTAPPPPNTGRHRLLGEAAALEIPPPNIQKRLDIAPEKEDKEGYWPTQERWLSNVAAYIVPNEEAPRKCDSPKELHIFRTPSCRS